uniref:Uncharacterized protein n=1 Tax=Arundo donax TaxID=35708 RepID=A0A0A9GKV6_ARUDO
MYTCPPPSAPPSPSSP